MSIHFRTMTCGDVRPAHVGKQITLSGWVHRIRNLGAMVFVDLRDRYGITQVIFDLKFTPQTVYELAKTIGHEFVIMIEGTVVMRESPNPKLTTGLVEIQTQQLNILSEASVPPFPIADETTEVNEELRLRYRYLDMRKGKIISNLVLRHHVMQVARQALSEHGFIEVTTPMLTKATPEGSRDYLVPSRIHQGQFYALPQSPQMFKQLLMIGGLDRYFQVATCCRDEDLRADRQPEFQQIDIEMSFGTKEDLFPIVEKVLHRIFHDCKGIFLPTPFRRLTYRECMERFGSDKPDLRFSMELIEATSLAKSSSFQPFVEAISAGGVVKGLTLKGGACLSRKEVEEYQNLVAQFGFKGLGWVKRQADGLQGPLVKYIDQAAWMERFELEIGDIAFVLAGSKKRLLQALDQLRRRLAKDFDLISLDRYEPLWVIDFPLFSWNEDEGKLESENHPFTLPHVDDIPLLEKTPLDVRSSGYDLVLNGYELSSGSQRIHDGSLQELIFKLLGFSEEERRMRFGFFIEALTFGTPPHLGMALGLDRINMILAETDNIRDVLAFPKNQRAVDLMMTAPSEVPVQQLNELGIKVRET